MTEILVTYYNIIVNNGYYLKRWLKILDTMQGKEKGMGDGTLLNRGALPNTSGGDFP